MPIIKSAYEPKNPLFRNPHVNTIWANLIRRIPRVKYSRERIVVDEVDFLDLDWAKVNSKKLIIVLAGLEGKSNSHYAKALTRHFNKKSWDVLCMNYRGCSGEANNLLHGYHMGSTQDIKLTIQHTINEYDYDEIAIVGYSLGGNIALKYIAEEADNLPKQLSACVSFSVPLDIKKSNERLSRWYNWHYLKWFMIPLNYKANKKKKQFPGKIDSYKGFFMSGSFLYFDTHFTAPANGFKSVDEYWSKSTSLPLLNRIKIPTLIVASEDDTFISENCYPREIAKASKRLTLEISKHGGHCGFIGSFFEKESWMEERTFEFIESIR